jgi:large subunit ribosomal protein L15
MENEKIYLNKISPNAGSKTTKKRVGRGIGCGFGKTAGRGHKGQKSRSGGFHKVGFEGGQMPLHRRLPKRGFTAPFGKYTEQVRLSEIDSVKLNGDEKINLALLKKLGLVNSLARRVKVFLSGTINKTVHLEGIAVTPRVKEAIYSAGGSVTMPSVENKNKKQDIN